MRILRAAIAVPSDASGALPAAGKLSVQDKRVYLGCADGALEVLEIKPDGKRAMEARAWAAGIHGAELCWELLA